MKNSHSSWKQVTPVPCHNRQWQCDFTYKCLCGFIYLCTAHTYIKSLITSYLLESKISFPFDYIYFFPPFINSTFHLKMEAIVKSCLAPRWQYCHRGGKAYVTKTLFRLSFWVGTMPVWQMGINNGINVPLHVPVHLLCLPRERLSSKIVQTAVHSEFLSLLLRRDVNTNPFLS